MTTWIARTAVGLLVFGATACGGSSSTDGNVNVNGNDLGSFELTATNVEVVSTSPPQTQDAKLEYVVRVDLRNGDSGLQAVVTPLGGTPAAYQVSGTGPLTLSAPAQSAATMSVAADRDAWATLRIHGTSFDADIEREVSCGDCYWNETLHVSGSVSKDIHPATFSVSTDMSGHSDTALPWSTLTLRADEGVDAAALADHVKVVTDAGEALPASWQPEAPAQGTEWAGTGWFQGTFDDFSAFQDSRDVSVVVGEGVPDLAGNASTQFTTPIHVLGMGAAKSSLTFGSAAPDWGSWGTSSTLSAGASACDSDGCLLIGPEASCGSASGVVARLATAGKQHITVRARALAASADYFYGSAFSLTIATPHAAPVTQPIIEGQMTLSALPEPVGGAGFATDWVTTSFDVPPGASEVGIAIGSQFQGCFYGTPSADRAIVIDSIDAT